MDSANERVKQQTADQVAAWLEEVQVSLSMGSGATRYPLSVLVLASAIDSANTNMRLLTLVDAPAKDRPDGWTQALYMSRDLLSVLQMLDTDFKLQLPGLQELIHAHPLFQQVG